MSVLAETELKEELRRVAEECSVANWDGYDALPVKPETYAAACRLIEALPEELPAPSVGAEADGHLTLEWHQAARRTVSVSVSPEGDLHYAALLDDQAAAGTEAFRGELPAVLFEVIRRVYSK